MPKAEGYPAFYCGQKLEAGENGALRVAECKGAKHGKPATPAISMFIHDPAISSWVVDMDFSDGWRGRAIYANAYEPWTRDGVYAGLESWKGSGTYQNVLFPMSYFGVTYEEFAPGDPRRDYFYNTSSTACPAPAVAAKDQNGVPRCFAPCPPGMDLSYIWPEKAETRCKCEVGLPAYNPGADLPYGCELPPPGSSSGIVCRGGVALFDPVAQRMRCYPGCPAGLVRTPLWPPTDAGCACPEGELPVYGPGGGIARCRKAGARKPRERWLYPGPGVWVPWKA